jgi:hypothetical protein
MAYSTRSNPGGASATSRSLSWMSGSLVSTLKLCEKLTSAICAAAARTISARP